MKKDILILGAGPAGLACAFELSRAKKNFLLVEKNEAVGGLSRTLRFGEFETDIGPHRFFSQNQYLYQMIEGLLGEHWIKVNRLTRFFINNKFFLYPVELKDALKNVGLKRAIKIIGDFLFQKVKKIFVKKTPSSFEEKAVGDFGRSLAELNMLNYTEKIWGMPCSEISIDWADQRIKGLSLIEVVKKALFKPKNGPKTLVDQFYYSDEGTSLIYQAMERKALEVGELMVQAEPIKIIHNSKAITEVIIRSSQGDVSISPQFCVSSIPITEFIKLLQPQAPDNILQAVKKLRFRSHISLFLILPNRATVFPDQWIYLPDKGIPFGRIMEPKNFSPKMSPRSKTSLLLEFFCWENDQLWNMSKEGLLEISLPYLENLGLKKEEIGQVFLHKEKYAYPVYDINYKENLVPVKNFLSNFENLQLIGRAGSFRYNNQDHALEMGIMAARAIIENKQYNLEQIGAEQAYFERGHLDKLNKSGQTSSKLL